jgi:hypothetical protein
VRECIVGKIKKSFEGVRGFIVGKIKKSFEG